MITPCRSRTVCAGRAPSVRSSTLTESMPTRVAPRAARSSQASAVRYGCPPAPYASVPQCRSHPVCSSTALPRTSYGASSSAVDRGRRLGQPDHQPGQVDQVRERDASQVGALGEPVRRHIQVRSGVGHHRDPSDVELRAGRVAGPRVDPAQMVGDLRAGQAGERDHAVVDRVAQIHQRSRLAPASVGRFRGTAAGAFVRLAQDLLVGQPDLGHEQQPEMRDEVGGQVGVGDVRRRRCRVGSLRSAGRRRWRSSRRRRTGPGTPRSLARMPRAAQVLGRAPCNEKR